MHVNVICDLCKKYVIPEFVMSLIVFAIFESSMSLL